MKKIIFGFLFLAVCIMACGDDQDDFVGSGNIISEDRDESDFSSIDVSTIIDVNVTYDLAQSVTVTANDNIIDRVSTTVSGSTLIISLKDGNYDNVSITVDITIPNLTGVHNEGTGNVSFTEFANLDNVSIESIGTGNISAQGNSDKLTVELTGTGNFNGFDFLTKTIKATLTGTGNIEVYCTDELDGSITGTGSIFYKGNPSIDVSVTGTGKIVDAN